MKQKPMTAEYEQGMKTGIYSVAHDIVEEMVPQVRSRSQDYIDGFGRGLAMGLVELQKILKEKRAQAQKENV